MNEHVETLNPALITLHVDLFIRGCHGNCDVCSPHSQSSQSVSGGRASLVKRWNFQQMNSQISASL